MEKIIIYQGDTPTFNFTVTEDGAAMDLTSVTIRFSAKASYDATSYLFNRTDPLVHNSAGLCTFILTALNTATPGLYYAEVEIVTTSNAIYTVVQFILEIREQVGSAT